MSQPRLFIALCDIAGPLVTYLVLSIASCEAVALLRGPHRDDSKCFHFKQYHPSAWESEWQAERGNYAKAICQHMEPAVNQSHRWLNYTSSQRLTQLQPQDRDVLSWFEYVDVCDRGRSSFAPIEPLVGLLRHPFSHPACNFAGLAIDIEDRSHLVIDTGFHGTGTTLGQGKRSFLIDMGCGTHYGSSLQWFIEQYAQSHLKFDEIWAWEAIAVTAADFWATVPENISSKVHFYNVFLNANVTSLASPLQILQRHARDAKAIVLKLDIDNEELEETFVQTMMAEGLLSHVTEIFYEEHFDSPEMRKFFGQPERTWTQTIQRFHELRKLGVRVHYWP